MQDKYFRTGKATIAVAVLLCICATLSVLAFAFSRRCYAVAEKGTLTVLKFHDYNNDGVWDDDEPALEGGEVLINGHLYPLPLTLELEPGEYTVADATPVGWEPTTFAELTVMLAGGESRTVFFGNAEEVQEIIIMPEPPAPVASVTMISSEVSPAGQALSAPAGAAEQEKGSTAEAPLLPRTGTVLPGHWGAALLLCFSAYLLRQKRSK